MFVIPCFFLLMPFSSAYKILFLPRDGSHSRAMSHYAQQLVLRGHSVKFWMFKSAYFYPAANITYTLESVDLPLKMKNSPFLQFHNFLTEIHPSLRPADLVLLLNESLYSCGRYLTRKNEDLIKLKSENWDLVVADEIPPNVCVRALTRLLNVPYVLWNTVLPPALFHDGVDMPQQSAFYPTFYHTKDGLKTFWQRLTNTLCHVLFSFLNLTTGLLSRVSRFHQIYLTDKFAQKSLLTLTQWPSDLDYVGPNSHRLVYSNLECPVTKRLKDPWINFIERQESNGTIVLSFGHFLHWNRRLIQGFFAAAQNLTNISFVWHLRVPQSLPHFNLTNVRIGAWLPLDNLLHHPKTLILVTHGGAKSILGGVCSNVPMLVIPHALDQFRNAAKIGESRLGEVCHQKFPNNTNILNSLTCLLDGKIPYRQNIQKMKEMMLDRIAPSEGITVFSLEKAIRQNASLKFFHSKGANLWFTQYYSFDICMIGVSMISTCIISSIPFYQ